ncbi:MAG: sugar ABC transporter permease [Clostridia bacterium]|nr:sugar ABC transporter permease [Clostridia bacterium]
MMINAQRDLRRRNERAKNLGLALYFIPALIFYAVFKYFPIIYSSVLSFAKWNFVRDISWIGVKNYVDMFSRTMFVTGLGNTFRYIVAFLPFFIVLPLLLAVLLLYVKNRVAQSAFKSLLFIPTVLALSICCMVWLWIYSPSFGFLNRLLTSFGFSSISWLSDKSFAFGAVIVVCAWKYMGQNLILFMAGLLNVPEECVEAAHIDGANEWQCFWRVRFPLIMPTVVYMFITSVIFAADRAFTAIHILTTGGPSYTTTNLAYVIYEFAFKSYNIGMASAIAVFTSALYLIITVIMMKTLGGFEYHE